MEGSGRCESTWVDVNPLEQYSSGLETGNKSERLFLPTLFKGPNCYSFPPTICFIIYNSLTFFFNAAFCPG